MKDPTVKGKNSNVQQLRDHRRKAQPGSPGELVQFELDRRPRLLLAELAKARGVSEDAIVQEAVKLKLREWEADGSAACSDPFPIRGETKTFAVGPDQTGMLDLIANIDGLRLFVDEHGAFVLDRQLGGDSHTGEGGTYKILRQRSVVSRETALHELLLAAIPEEFNDLTWPLLRKLNKHRRLEESETRRGNLK